MTNGEENQSNEGVEKTNGRPVEEGAHVGDISKSPINPVDVSRATRKATEYLEGIYGNLNILMFRIEEVEKNGDETKYHVLCSLLTNVGGPRTYYFIKVDVQDGDILKISKGFRNLDTNKIDWKKENIPEED